MQEQKTDMAPTLPSYIKMIYTVYENLKLSRFFDNRFLLGLVTFGRRKTLIQAVLREIEPSRDVLQIGATFGNQIEKVSSKIGYYGNYHLVDVSRIQTERCKKKYKGIYQNMNFSNQNGLAKTNRKYDCTISFMLLHELPPKTRKAMVDSLLDTVKENGKVVFIDYHKAEKPGFMTYLSKKFNLLDRPFVDEFTAQEISGLASRSDNFVWHKSTMFNGCYQKVVAVKKTKKVS